MSNEEMLKAKLCQFQQTMDQFNEIVSVITLEILSRDEEDIVGGITLLQELIERADKLNAKFSEQADSLLDGAEFGYREEDSNNGS